MAVIYKQAALISEGVVAVNREKQIGLRSKSDCSLKQGMVCEILGL